MKIAEKIIGVLLAVAILALVLYLVIGFYTERNKYIDPVEKDLKTIQTVADMFEDKLTELGVDEQMVNDVINEIEEYNKETNYVIAFNVKNETNSIINLSIHLPVDETFFNSVEIGDLITEEKIGNFEELNQFLNGWAITVKDKIVRE